MNNQPKNLANKITTSGNMVRSSTNIEAKDPEETTEINETNETNETVENNNNTEDEEAENIKSVELSGRDAENMVASKNLTKKRNAGNSGSGNAGNARNAGNAGNSGNAGNAGSGNTGSTSTGNAGNAGNVNKKGKNLTVKNTGRTATAVEDKTKGEAKGEAKGNIHSLNNVAMNLLNHQIVMKLFHFQTELYGAHKASDAYLEKFALTMDKFLEIAQGIYGRITIKKYTLNGSSHTDENIVKHIDVIIKLLRTKINDILADYTDLINVRDELVGDAEQLKYLLTFK